MNVNTVYPIYTRKSVFFMHLSSYATNVHIQKLPCNMMLLPDK